MPRLFLSILVGDDPNTARPLLASESPDLIRAVALELIAQLTTDHAGHDRDMGRLLVLVRDGDEGGAEP